MQVHEDVDIVIVGAGLAGLTTALALHRFKMAYPGTDVFASGLFCFNCLSFFLPCSPDYKASHYLTSLCEGYESRCIRRKDLLETLENKLPPGTIRYSSKVAAINELNRFKLVHLADGFILKTKVLIGCDGVNSFVARWLDLGAPVSVGRSAIRGLVEFPNGSGLDPMSYLNFGGGTRFGFRPVDDKTAYWFCTFTSSRDEEELQENPIKMKQFVLNRINNMPREAQEVVEKTLLSSIFYSPLKLRLPWHVLFGNIVKENVCVAGDALHPMTPDINQGGCSAIEDAIVLGRCLGEAFLKESSEKDDEFDRVTKGLVKYGRERRRRSVILISVAYCVGFIQQENDEFLEESMVI